MCSKAEIAALIAEAKPGALTLDGGKGSGALLQRRRLAS